MKSSSLEQLKTKLLLSLAYLVLMVILLIGISTAKFTDRRMAYTRYGAGSFNAVILGDTSGGEMQAFDQTISARDCVPGMTFASDDTNTAKTIPFSVANGVALADGTDNASDATLDYTIRLRTTRNLPLNFKLEHAVTTGEGTTHTYYDAVGPTALSETVADGELGWYEWQFVVTDESGDMPVVTEATFSLDGGVLCQNSHTLYVEWPITSESVNGAALTTGNTAEYMKEIDLLEVLVTASSRNSLDGESSTITYSAGDLYGKGVVILDRDGSRIDSSDTDYPYHYNYEIDLRAFRSEGTAKAYYFELSNGAAFGIAQNETYTDYVLELKTPYTVSVTDENGNETAAATKDYAYTLYRRGDGDTYDICAASGTEYRLYNVKYNSDPVSNTFDTKVSAGGVDYTASHTVGGYGTYCTVTLGSNYNATYTAAVEQALIAAWSREDSPLRLYKVYTFNGPFRLINKSADSAADYADSDEFRIALTGAQALIDNQTAVDNRLELVVRARQTAGGVQG